MTRRILIARPARAWRRPVLAVAGMVAQLLLGLLVAVVRIVRALVDLSADGLVRAETRLAAATRRPALSQGVIGRLAVAFVTEFHTAYTTTTHH